MSKLHRDNAGYVGCSYEETQDPYYSYNKLSLPLAASDKTVIREEQTFVVTQANGKFVIDGVSQAQLTLVEGNVYTFDLSDSSVGSHPFRIKKNPDTSANSLTSGLPTGYSATSGLYTGTLSDIETDDANYIQATSSHIYFDLGAVKKIHNFIAKWTSYVDDANSADYRIALYSDSNFTTLLAASPSAASENTSDVVTVDHDFGGVEARYVSFEYVGGGRVARLRYFYPYADTTDVTLTTSGTQGQSGATAKYVVPFGSGPLAYYCASHPGMGADITTPANASMFDGALPILTTTDALGKTLGTGNNEDPYAANLVLAIPMNGSNNGTTFTDVSNVIRGSGSAHAVSVAGNTKTVTSEFQYYGSSAAFDNSGDYLSLPDTSALHLNGAECTIEGWFYTNDAPGAGGGNAVPFFAQADVNTSSTSGTANFWSFADSSYWYFGSSTGYMLISPSNIPVGSWFHFACVVTNTTEAKMYVNGELKGEGTIGAIGSGTSRTTNLGVITSGSNAKSYLNGYIQDFRMYNVAKYTSNFTAPGPINLFDLSGNGNNASNAGATWQTNVSKFYGGAVAFDNSHLTIEETLDFDFGGDFCFETWYYGNGFATTNGTTNIICSTQTLDRFQIWNATDYSFRIYLNSNNLIASPSNSLGHNAWYHLAATRENSTVRLFINGSEVASGTESSSIDLTNLYIGTQYRNGAPGYHHMKAMLQDLRIYQNHAKYTSSFTPPERSVQGTARRYPSGVFVVS